MFDKIADAYYGIKTGFQFRSMLRRGRKLQPATTATASAPDLMFELREIGDTIIQTRLDSIEYRARKLVEEHEGPEALARFDRDMLATRNGVHRLAGQPVETTEKVTEDA